MGILPMTLKISRSAGIRRKRAMGAIFRGYRQDAGICRRDAGAPRRNVPRRNAPHRNAPHSLFEALESAVQRLVEAGFLLLESVADGVLAG